ncbi:MAG: septum formation initiator family protein [Oscillospiraceae bacterium]|nr:septum formation initiator family protein [Oscillospiraceae bacterium]
MTIVALQPRISALKAEGAALSEEISELQHANRAAQIKLDSLGSDEAVIAAAREKLNFAFEDEIIFVDRSK